MDNKEKSQAEILKEKLFYKPEHACEKLPKQEIEKADNFCGGYKLFLDAAKTERESVTYIQNLLQKNGYTEFDPGKKYAAGEKIYSNNRGKALILATIGSRPLSDGLRIIASHIDSPRIDLKPRPLYEEAQIAMFKTHYYGGIKKYQWAAMPLSLHGVVIRSDGSMLEVNIGEDERDPVFCTTDLLPHLGNEQAKRLMPDVIKGEELNILIGSRPFKDDKAGEKVKLNIASLLFDKYNIIEKDFISAELSAVPAYKARDVGFDRSMIGAYGHDDRVCAYASVMAALDSKNPDYTCVTVLADKEETGSEGNTGLKSAYLRNFIAGLARADSVGKGAVLSKSRCLSADVNCAFDPTFPDVTEKNNTAYINYGVVVTKYTGSRGKSDTNDASAEFVGNIRRLLDGNGIIWQIGELGKVDAGGGGTVAKYIADLDVDTIDIGVPVISMHSPFEIVSKTDVYMAYKTFLAFFKEK